MTRTLLNALGVLMLIIITILMVSYPVSIEWCH